MSKNRGPNTEEIVKNFYDNFGWKKGNSDLSGEDVLFRTFPEGYQAYSDSAQERTLQAFGEKRGRLLVVGCGDFPESHIAIANQFSSVTCMDISERALEITRKKLKGQSDTILASILDNNLPSGEFDSVFCSHVLYHIDATQQEAAVQQMLRLTKSGGRVVILYTNPHSPFAIPGEIFRFIRKKLGHERATGPAEPPPLYYHAHTLRWWRRFQDQAAVTLAPWQVIGSRPARALLRSKAASRAFFRIARFIEAFSPRLAVRGWQYLIVVLAR